MWDDIEKFKSEPSALSGNKFQKKEGWTKKFPPKEDFDPDNTFIYRPFAFAVNKDFPTDDHIEFITALVRKFNEDHFTVRVGGNKDIDEYFEEHMKLKEVHLPWRNFNEKQSKFTFNSPQANHIAKTFFPAYEKVPDSVKAFLARNVRLVVGNTLKSPILFLITWSPDGAENATETSMKTGNVGHLINVASALRVPIFNLAKPTTRQRLTTYLKMKEDH